MKRTFICLLATLTVAAFNCVPARALGTEITASGTGSVSLAPNMATVNSGIETNAERADDAIAQNNVIYDRIVASLTRLGIARSDITLAYYNINYNPRPRVMPPNPSSERYGYTVSRNFEVKVRKIGDAGRVSDACMSAGASAINGVSFGLSDPTVARNQATQRAVSEARANAEAIARAATLHIVGIKSVTFGEGPSGPPAPLMRGVASNVFSTTKLDQGNVSVTVSVTLTFSGPLHSRETQPPDAR
jgi:uncharacterized protein